MTTDAYGGDCPGMAGRDHYGAGSLGILGSALAAAGFIAASLTGADMGKEYYGLITEIPAGLTIDVGEAGDFDASAPFDGTYVVPWDLYEYGAPLGSTSFSVTFGTGVMVNLGISNLATNASLSTAAVVITPAAGTVRNLVISNLSTAATLSTGAVTVTPADEPSPVTSLAVIPERRMRRMPAQNRMARF